MIIIKKIQNNKVNQASMIVRKKCEFPVIIFKDKVLIWIIQIIK